MAEVFRVSGTVDLREGGDVSAQLDEIERKGKEAGIALDRVEKEAKQAGSALGKEFAPSLRNAGLAAGVMATAMGLVIGQLVGAASNAVETQNKFNESFQGMADEANELADEIADSFGRSRTQVQGFMADLQAVLSPMIGNRQEAARMSEALTTLTFDLASFHNLAESDVLIRLRSGMLGSIEAVDQLGINLRQTELEQEALNQGMEKSFAQMTEQEKIFLRFNVIMRQTADAQGDVARNQHTFAEATRQLNAQIGQLSVSLGESLLPVATEVLGLLTQAVSFVNDLNESTNGLIATIGTGAFGAVATFAALAAATFGVVTAVRALATAFKGAIGPAGWIVLAIELVASLAAGFGLASVQADRAFDAVLRTADLKQLNDELARLQEELKKTQDEIAFIERASGSGGFTLPISRGREEELKEQIRLIKERIAAIKAEKKEAAKAAEENATTRRLREEREAAEKLHDTLVDLGQAAVAEQIRRLSDQLFAAEDLQTALDRLVEFRDGVRALLDEAVSAEQVRAIREQVRGLIGFETFLPEESRKAFHDVLSSLVEEARVRVIDLGFELAKAMAEATGDHVPLLEAALFRLINGAADQAVENTAQVRQILSGLTSDILQGLTADDPAVQAEARANLDRLSGLWNAFAQGLRQTIPADLFDPLQASMDEFFASAPKQIPPWELAMQQVEAAFEKIDLQAELLGDSFDAQAAKAAVVRQAIQLLIDQGVDPLTGGYTELVMLLHQLEQETTEWSEVLNELAGLLEAVGIQGQSLLKLFELIGRAAAGDVTAAVQAAVMVVTELLTSIQRVQEAAARVRQEVARIRGETAGTRAEFQDLIESGFRGSFETAKRIVREDTKILFGLITIRNEETVRQVTEATLAWMERMRGLLDDFSSGVSGSLREALTSAFEIDDSQADRLLKGWEHFTRGIKDTLFGQITDAIVTAFLNSRMVTRAVAPFLQSLDEAVTAATVGGGFDAAAFEKALAPGIAKFQARLPGLRAGFEAVSNLVSGLADDLGVQLGVEPPPEAGGPRTIVQAPPIGLVRVDPMQQPIGPQVTRPFVGELHIHNPRATPEEELRLFETASRRLAMEMGVA